MTKNIIAVLTIGLLGLSQGYAENTDYQTYNIENTDAKTMVLELQVGTQDLEYDVCVEGGSLMYAQTEYHSTATREGSLNSIKDYQSIVFKDLNFNVLEGAFPVACAEENGSVIEVLKPKTRTVEIPVLNEASISLSLPEGIEFKQLNFKF